MKSVESLVPGPVDHPKKMALKKVNGGGFTNCFTVCLFFFTLVNLELLYV